MPLKTADFDYALPPELIAQHPADRRDGSRLLVCKRDGGGLEHRHFSHIIDYIRPGDCLVLNNSRVMPACFRGHRATGGACELLLLRNRGGDVWQCLVKPGRRLPVGSRMFFGENDALQGEILSVTDDGGRMVQFSYEGDWDECCARWGTAPLPPYITETLSDPRRYQTVYAKESGSAAAPTAGLHFTPELLAGLEASGVVIAELTLHVGLGTFRPVKALMADDHVMHSEVYEVSPETAGAVNDCRARGGRIIAVGSTSCRTLEAAARDGRLEPGRAETNIFIRPGYRFQMTDMLITNFHLPKSSLLMLISAFWQREAVLKAYETAVEMGYRFFSFGDCCLFI